ncbi:hypothetical protein pb186bvf_019258 [Paramecium bursaria]
MKFDQVFVKRSAKYAPLALVFGLYVFNDHFNRKVERGILKPIRNYGRHLGQENEFKLEEDFYDFLGDVGQGFLNVLNPWK